MTLGCGKQIRALAGWVGLVANTPFTRGTAHPFLIPMMRGREGRQRQKKKVVGSKVVDGKNQLQGVGWRRRVKMDGTNT